MEERHLQSLEDIRIDIHSIKDDGTDNTGDVANLSTFIRDSEGNDLVSVINYTAPTIAEIDRS